MTYKNGDLIFYGGKSFISEAIKFKTRSDISHIEMYVDHVDYGPCTFGSTTLCDLPDKIKHKKIQGVQLVDFNDRTSTYDGDIWVRRLNKPLNTAQEAVLYHFINEHHGKPYEKDTFELMLAAFDLAENKLFTRFFEDSEKDDKTLFCSETIAMLLRDISIAKRGPLPAHKFAPSEVPDELGLLDGYFYGAPESI